MSNLHFSKSHQEAGCKRTTCLFIDAGYAGGNKCLMEYARARWVNPSAENYCCDPQAQKFVDIFHLNRESHI